MERSRERGAGGWGERFKEKQRKGEMGNEKDAIC